MAPFYLIPVLVVWSNSENIFCATCSSKDLTWQQWLKKCTDYQENASALHAGDEWSKNIFYYSVNGDSRHTFSTFVEKFQNTQSDDFRRKRETSFSYMGMNTMYTVRCVMGADFGAITMSNSIASFQPIVALNARVKLGAVQFWDALSTVAQFIFYLTSDAVFFSRISINDARMLNNLPEQLLFLNHYVAHRINEDVPLIAEENDDLLYRNTKLMAKNKDGLTPGQEYIVQPEIYWNQIALLRLIWQLSALCVQEDSSTFDGFLFTQEKYRGLVALTSALSNPAVPHVTLHKLMEYITAGRAEIACVKKELFQHEEFGIHIEPSPFSSGHRPPTTPQQLSLLKKVLQKCQLNAHSEYEALKSHDQTLFERFEAEKKKIKAKIQTMKEEARLRERQGNISTASATTDPLNSNAIPVLSDPGFPKASSRKDKKKGCFPFCQKKL